MSHHARRVRSRTGFTLLVAVILALGLATVARASGNGTAVTYQIDIAHDGVQVDPALTAQSLTRKWSVTLSNSLSYPLIAAGMIFVTGNNPAGNGTILYGLDQWDGRVVWSQPISGTYYWSYAAYDAGRVFVVNSNGLLRAFNAADGSPAWSATMPGQYMFTAPPTADSGVVYLGGAGSGGTLYEVSESTGAVLRTASVMNGDNSSPTLSDSAVFVSYACNQTYAFSRAALQPLWHYNGPCEGGGGATAPFAGGRLFTQDYFGNDVFDASSGSLLGTWGSNYDSGLASDGTTLWAMTSCSSGAGCTLVARDVASGSTLWSFAGNGGLTGRPIVISNGTSSFVVIEATDGTLYALDAATGQQRWSTSDYPFPSGTYPQGFAAGQGLLVVPSGAHLTAYGQDTTAPTITVPGPITASATSSNGAAVTYSVTASDPDSSASVSCDPPSGSVFPIGTTTVSCAASDPAGNTAYASFQVTVNPDTTAPTLSLPSRITVGASSASGAAVAYSATATDLDSPASVSCYPPSGSVFPIGTTTVSCTASDPAGNSSAGSFQVTVTAPGAICELTGYPRKKGVLQIANANLGGCYLANADFTNATATSTNFSAAYLAGAVFSGANLMNAQFASANLLGARFDGANLKNVRWTSATCPDGTNSDDNKGTCIGHLT